MNEAIALIKETLTRNKNSLQLWKLYLTIQIEQTKDENKNILYNCDGSPYNIFEALEAAYTIKNNENDTTYNDKYKPKQCNNVNADFKKQNTCTCILFYHLPLMF
jgi:hypothetical protein